jgi:hypothetical protein
MGKGSDRRPAQVRDDVVAAEWARVFAGSRAAPSLPSACAFNVVREPDTHADMPAPSIPTVS